MNDYFKLYNLDMPWIFLIALFAISICAAIIIFNVCKIRRIHRAREISYMGTLTTEQKLLYLQLREMRKSRKAIQIMMNNFYRR